MNKAELITSIKTLINNPSMINVEDVNGESIHDNKDSEQNKIFLRGVDVGFEICIDMIKNS